MADLSEVTAFINGLGALGLGWYKAIATGGKSIVTPVMTPSVAVTPASGLSSVSVSTWLLIGGAALLALVLILPRARR